MEDVARADRDPAEAFARHREALDLAREPDEGFWVRVAVEGDDNAWRDRAFDGDALGPRERMVQGRDEAEIPCP